MATQADGWQPSTGLSPAERLGRDIAILLFESGWLRRRRDAVELLSDAWVRWRTSIDCVIPRSLEPFGHSSDGEPLYLLPIALLPKVPPALMRFDFDWEQGRLWLPLRRENALASYATLLYAATRTLGFERGSQLPRELREHLLFVAAGPPEYAEPFARRLLAPRRGFPEVSALDDAPAVEQAENELNAWVGQMLGAEQKTAESTRHLNSDDKAQVPPSRLELREMYLELAQDELSSWLIGNLAVASVILAHVEPGRDGHKLVRLSYDAPIFKSPEPEGADVAPTLGWEAINLVISTPYVGAHSYHFEFVGTNGIEVCDSTLLSSDDERDKRYVRQDSNRVHHYCSDATGIDRITTIVRLRVARENFLWPALVAASAVAIVILACGALAQPLVRHGTGAATLLLLFPGVAATLLGASTRHPLTTRVLRLAHFALLVSALCAYLTAAVLAFIHTGGHANAAGWVRGVWLGLGALAVGPAGVLYVAYKLPRAASEQGRLERLSDALRQIALRTTREWTRWRQRHLRLLVYAPGLDRDRARGLESASYSSRRFSVHWRRRSLLLPYQRVLELRARPERRARRRRPIALSTTAKPTDATITQPIDSRRRLAMTLLWLARELPDDYEFEARWPRTLERTRTLASHLLRNARSAWRRLRGRSERPRRSRNRLTHRLRSGWRQLLGTEPRRPSEPVSHVTASDLAALVRAEKARLNHRYRVESR